MHVKNIFDIMLESKKVIFQYEFYLYLVKIKNIKKSYFMPNIHLFLICFLDLHVSVHFTL